MTASSLHCTPEAANNPVTMATKKLLNIDIVSDIMCPWCWVGKRKLEEAMKRSAEKYEFIVKWHPFVLQPGLPLEGEPKGMPTAQG